MKIVNIDELRKVAVEYRADVDVWEVAKEAEDLYKAVKLVGIQNVTTTYGKEERSWDKISKRVRALAAYIMMHTLQMRDSSLSVNRLQEHFGDVSIETHLGYRMGINGVSLTTLSIAEIIEKYIGSGREVEKSTNKKFWAKSLYELIVKNNRNVDLFSLWSECENLYLSIVTVGLDDTVIWLNDNGKEIILKGKEIPERMRAFSLFTVVHMYRLQDDDVHMKYLEERYELPFSVRIILGDTDIFMDKLDNLKCISLNEIVGRYFKEKDTRRIEARKIYFQTPYDAIEMKLLDTEYTDSIYHMWEAMDAFYKASKIVGIDNVSVKYIDANKKPDTVEGRNVAPRIRAFVEEAVLYMYRMSDSSESRSRLEHHLGLEYSSRFILGDTKVVCCSNNISMPCVSMKELIEEI